jgi:hypothetical protein
MYHLVDERGIRLGCPLVEYLFEYFFLENYSLFEYFLTEYSNNKILLNKPYKNVNFQTIFPKKLLKHLKIQFSNLLTLLSANQPLNMIFWYFYPIWIFLDFFDFFEILG